MKRILKRVPFLSIDNEAMAGYVRPIDPGDYEIPELDGSGPAAADVPVVRTAPDASWNVWPPLVLAGCREPLVAGAPDLRGVWEVVEGKMAGHVERIEQAGNRITITTGGLVHDMFCDATLENGVNDTSGIGGAQVRVAASFEGGVHKLRPFNKKIVAVTRKRDGDEMLWRYGPFRNRLRRLTKPPLEHPATRAAFEAAEAARDELWT